MATQNFSQTLKTIEKLRKDLAAAEKSAAKSLMEDLKSFVKENPLVEGFKWQQYTPHFNDGEPCEFGVHGPYIKFDESLHKVDPDNDYNSGYLNCGDYGDVDDEFFKKKEDILNTKEINELKKSCKNAVKLFNHLSEMESELRDTFGDGVEVTLTKDGVEVENYDHD
jgi:hypothetical protein